MQEQNYMTNLSTEKQLLKTLKNILLIVKKIDYQYQLNIYTKQLNQWIIDYVWR